MFERFLGSARPPRSKALARCFARFFVRYRRRRCDLVRASTDNVEGTATFYWESFAGEKRLGSVGLNLIPAPDGPIGQVHGLEVREASRQLGIGTRLMRDLVAFARKNGCRHLDLAVEPEALAAQRLYRKMGFTDTGRREGLRQLILMRKSLKAGHRLAFLSDR